MPDVNGVLTQAERDAIETWYQERWRQRRCSVCNSVDWIVADHVVMPMIYSEIQIYSTGQMNYPQIMISCRNCGLTLYFNAVTVGIIGGR